MEVWESRRWRAAQEAHHQRVDALTSGRIARRESGAVHPVEDFLWVYYPYRPGRLRRWHPGPGIVLADVDQTTPGPDEPTAPEPARVHEGTGPEGTGQEARALWRFYARDARGGTYLDLAAFRAARGDLVRHVAALLTATAGRPPSYGCFGLHEWAMLYRLEPGQRRHERLPLRVPPEAIDAVVLESGVRCSHFDAYRFFTPAARPLNLLTLTRESTVAHEQPGCLHATMDLYKWAISLAPGVPSALAVDALELAFAARELDMRASPYDVSGFGLAPVPVESAAGRTQYVTLQRGIVERGQHLRSRLAEAVDALR